MSMTINSFKFQSAKVFDKGKNDRDVHAGEHPITDIDMRLNKNVVQRGPAVTDDTPLKAKRSEGMKLVRSSPMPDMCDVQAKKQTKIISKVKSAKDNITKLLKANTRVSPATSNLGLFPNPIFQQPCIQNGHQSLSLTSISQSAIPSVRVIMVMDPLFSGQTRLETIASPVAYRERIVEDHVEDSVSILPSTTEGPSSSPLAQLLAVPESQCTRRFTFLFNELHTIEEEDGSPEVDAEDVHLESNKLTLSSPRGFLATSDTETKYDEMLAAEFATFSFDSDDIQEWSDEVERAKQAEMDAHFTYVSEALAVPIPKLSAYFANKPTTDFATVNKDECTSHPSPVKTETSASSADCSLVTSVDMEENGPRLSPTTLCGLGRVKIFEDLRSLRMIMDCSDSFSDLSNWSFDPSLPNSPAVGSKTGALRRSVKCNDLRRTYLSLESRRCHVSSSETRASKNGPISFWRLSDPKLPAQGLTALPR